MSMRIFHKINSKWEGSVRTSALYTPPSPQAKGIWKKSEIAALHKKLNHNLKVLRKNRRMEKTAITSFILCTRMIDTMSRMVRVQHAGERKSAYRALMGKPDGKRPSGTPNRRRKDNIKNVLQ